jgi:protein-tyrosine phosphatase
MKKTTMFGPLAALALALGAGAPALHDTARAQAQAQAHVQAQTARAPIRQRLLPLEGGQNFRDLGGYRTADGRTVRWGLLYRSGAMNGLTAADFAYLSRLGIHAVCDFRSTEERHAAPVRWPGGATPAVFADDYKMDMAGFDLSGAAKWNAAQAKAAMAATYPKILKNFNSQYRRMFQQLLAGNAPLAFNCSAGKDRTGVAAALLLTALNVPRQTVIDDYLLSNRYFDPKKAANQSGVVPAAWKRIPPAVAQAFMGVDRSYIEAVFRVIDGHRGGATGYLRDELGLGAKELAILRRRYTG